MAIYWRTRKGETNTEFDPDTNETWEVPVTTKELFDAKIASQWGTCTFCGEPDASAYWRCAVHDVATCRRCAVETLPKLIADAVVGEHGDGPHIIGRVQPELEIIQKNFWMAVAVAIWRSVRCLRSTHEDKIPA
jgi:hypothetical protein